MAFPVKARQNTPPGSPANGDRYLVNTAPTGAWSGQANKFAVWYTSFWSFRAPVEGEETYLQDTDEWLFFNGTAWVTHPFSATGTPAATYLTPDSLGTFLTRANLDWGNQGTGDNAVVETIVNTGARPYWNWRITHPGTGGSTTTLQTRREWDLQGGALGDGEFVEVATIPQGGNDTFFYLRNPSSSVGCRIKESSIVGQYNFQRLTGFDLTSNGTITHDVSIDYPRLVRQPLTYFRFRRNGTSIEIWASAEGTVFARQHVHDFGSDASGFTRVGAQLSRNANGHCSVTWLKLTRGT